MMGLSKKTFLYSMVLAAVMVILITGYFVFMLPSLYVDYVMDSNLRSVIRVQKGYMEKRSYDELSVKNPSAVCSLEIPYKGTELYAAGKFFRLRASVQDEELREILETFQKKIEAVGEIDGTSEWGDLWKEEERTRLSALWTKLRKRFDEGSVFDEEFPVQFQLEGRNQAKVYKEEYAKIHREADNLFVWEMGVSDGDYEYTTYIAFGQTEDALILTVFPAMTPQMEEIRPVVMGSVPMIIAVVFLFVLIASRMFAGKIVRPIIRLAGYAGSAGLTEGFDMNAFDSDSKDEIGVLAHTLHELYDRLRENYQELERKNFALEEENERQEVFLRASSHQLKTPITAAMLLVDGMIQRVGKYSDTEKYLPEVRKELLAMRRIVEDILYLNYHAGHMQKELTDLRELTEELIRRYEVPAEAGGLEICLSGEAQVWTDREMMEKILDNLFSNAVQYTPPGSKICVELSSRLLRVTNYGVTVDDALLPHIFDPFVSSMGYQKGKGLGLYVASYYSRVLGYHLELYNQKDSVCAELSFKTTEGGQGKC